IVLFFIIFIFIFIRVRKSKNVTPAINGYLNLLFPVLLLSELILFISKTNQVEETGKEYHYTTCRECKKPDIYLLVFDEYAGNKELKECCQFDNSAFLGSLVKR